MDEEAMAHWGLSRQKKKKNKQKQIHGISVFATFDIERAK